MSDLGILQKPVPFGKYYLLEKVNTGGMAEVFKAKAFGVEGFERLLAIKRILPSIAEDEEFITMFIDEAKISVQLNHANIAQISELGKIDDDYFIAMEYVSGRDLRAIYDRAVKLNERLSIPQACYVIMRLCEGLDYAHSKRNEQGQELGIIHRDISPQNVLISYEGEVKLIDFGIAKAHGKGSQTQVGILKGKFSYMSPEQVRGGRLDRRSDVFSLGIVFYEILTLKRLFLGSSDFSTLEKIRKVEISPPTLFDPQIPQALEEIVLQSLARDVNERYQSAHEMQEAIHRFMFDQGLYFTNKDLASFMKSAFATEIKFEQKKLEYYSTLKKEDLDRSRRSNGGLGWEDEEGETNVYDKPSFGSARSKEEVLDALDNIELPSGGGIVYADSQDDIDDIDAPTLSMSTMDHLSLPDSEPAYANAPAPKHSGAAWNTVPQSAVPPPSMSGYPGQPAPRQGSGGKTAILVALVVLLLGLVGVVVWLVAFKESKGTPEPSAEQNTTQASAPTNAATSIITFDFSESTHAFLKERGLTNKATVTIKQGTEVVVSLENVQFPTQVAEIPLKKTLTYTVTKDGFEQNSSTLVVTKAEDSVEVELASKRVTLVLKAPDGAAVILDGKPIAGVGGSYKAANLEPRAVKLVVTKAGFASHEQLIDLSGVSEDAPIEIVLKKFVSLKVETNAKNNVTLSIKDLDTGDTIVDGKSLGSDPFSGLDPTHKYEIKATHPKHGDALLASWNPPQDSAEGSVKLEFSIQSTARRPRPPRDSSTNTTPKPKVDKPVVKKEPKKAPGVLEINSRPAATVYINGRKRGTTPTKITLKPGTYNVKLLAADKGVNTTKSVTISEGKVSKCAGGKSGIRCR